MSDCDVAVVGAGIIGCAVADELARRGARVAVFDGREVAGGATQASAGVLAPYIEAHDRGPLFADTIESLEMYDSFVRTVSADAGRAIEYRRSGTLETADTDERAHALQHIADTAVEKDVFEWLTPDAARALVHGLAESVRGGLLCRQHAYVSAPDLIAALVESARRRGAVFRANTPVGRIVPARDAFMVSAREHTYAAAQVVMCAGSWAGELDIASELRDQVRPVRGQLVRLRWEGPPLLTVLWGPDCYIVPWADGTLLVGATMEDVGFDECATVAGVSDLLDAACDLLPEARRASFLGVRVGLRPASRDGLPIVRPSATVPGLFFATGHYRNGILLAPLTAVRVADAVCPS